MWKLKKGRLFPLTNEEKTPEDHNIEKRTHVTQNLYKFQPH